MILSFDQETIDGFKKIINDDLAYCIFLFDWAIQKEIENHISTHLFQSPPHMQQTTLKLLWYYIERSKAKSVIGFTEGDSGLVGVATVVSYDKVFPHYSYNMEDAGAFSQFIEPAHCPCSLIIPYSTNDIQVNEIIERFAQQKIPIIQVISMIEEHPLKTDFSKKGIEYVKISDWESIKNRIQKFKNLTPEKMVELMSFFGNSS